MASPRLKLTFIVLLSALLNGCADLPPNYAPVTTNHPETAETPPSAPKEEPRFHLVKKNDTLYAISLLYDLDYRQLAQWNQILPPYKIEIGQKIKLSDPNQGNQAADATIPPAKNEDMRHITTAENIGSKKRSITPSNAVPNLAYRPVYKTQPIRDDSKKQGSRPQKKSIISIDKENMLMLNFQWPIKGKVLKSFSQADNKGIDIAGEMGQKVYAAEAGKVVYSGQGLIGYGNLLIIKHNDLYLSAYANNSQLLFTEGDTVKKGEVIAKVGQAGSNKTSLHFEIRKNGKPVNPLNLLPEK
jgi:lipoprotein NlpD